MKIAKSKLLIIIGVFVITLSLAACGGDNATNDKSITTQSPASTPDSTDDNDAEDLSSTSDADSQNNEDDLEIAVRTKI